jgi:hypothetical protein
VLKLQADIMKQKNDFELAVDKMGLDRMKLEADIGLIKANTILAIATAESKEVGQQFELYKHDMETLTEFVKMQMDAHQREKENAAADADRKIAAGAEGAGTDGEPAAGGPGGMVTGPEDAGGPAGLEGGPGGLPGTTPPGGNLEAALGGGDGAPVLPAIGAGLRAEFNRGSSPA